jgi:hypothetical protein
MKKFKELRTDSWYKDQPEWGTDEADKKARKVTPGQVDEISPGLKQRYAKKAQSDINLTKRDLSIAKDMNVPDVKNKLKRRLQTRRIGVARATEPRVSKNIFDSKK